MNRVFDGDEYWVTETEDKALTVTVRKQYLSIRIWYSGLSSETKKQFYVSGVLHQMYLVCSFD